MTLECNTQGADSYTFYYKNGAVSGVKQAANEWEISDYDFTKVGSYYCEAFNGDVEAQADSNTITLTLACKWIVFPNVVIPCSSQAHVLFLLCHILCGIHMLCI